VVGLDTPQQPLGRVTQSRFLEILQHRCAHGSPDLSATETLDLSSAASTSVDRLAVMQIVGVRAPSLI
jgi:hypothetical protein